VTLVQRSVGWRHGILAAAQPVTTAFADLDFANWSAMAEPFGAHGVAGGVDRVPASAAEAAVAEGLERYAAARAPLPLAEHDDPPSDAPVVGIDRFTLHSPTQRADPAFPFDGYHGPLTTAFSLADSRPVWVPAALVSLDPIYGSLATSSGLAAARSPLRALLRALQEVIERDALMITWLHGVGGRRVALSERLVGPVRARGGSVTALDLTPAYSSHPVAAVTGNLPLRGRARHSLGVACRSRWAEAVEKAYAEWAQGVVFAGLYRARDPAGHMRPGDVVDFDRHAAYYTAEPERWAALPIWLGADVAAPPDAPSDRLEDLVRSLASAGIDLYYRELTTVDVAHAGVRVVRVLAPGLTPIHGNHNWPHLGGTTPDLGCRYPWASAGCTFPNPAPHPLG
jgi:ribosomal protein S12 methylthiotransferase accessory factor